MRKVYRLNVCIFCKTSKNVKTGSSTLGCELAIALARPPLTELFLATLDQVGRQEILYQFILYGG